MKNSLLLEGFQLITTFIQLFLQPLQMLRN